jgi:uncharacterized membrane protein (DUF373 family)
MSLMEKPTLAPSERFVRVLHGAIFGIEGLVALTLTVLAAAALISLGRDIWIVASTGLALTHTEFINVMSGVLQVFILVELFRIAVAYMKHENVIPTVLEAALVAIARQFVVFEGGTNYLVMAVGLSLLLLSVAIAWWLLSRANACEMQTEG